MSIESLSSRIKSLKGSHARVHFSDEIKSETVLAFRSSGMPAAKFAKTIGISQGSLFNWLKTLESKSEGKFHKILISEEEVKPWSVLGPKGLRIEGLSLGHLAELIQALEAL